MRRNCSGCGRIVTPKPHPDDCDWCKDARIDIDIVNKNFLHKRIGEKLNSDQSKNLKPSEKTV